MVGRAIAMSEHSWLIDLAASRPVRQREVAVVRIDFRDGPEEWLRPFRDAPWLITAAGELPDVHLNARLKASKSCCGIPVPRWSVPRLVSAQIAEETWTAMF